MQQDSKIQYYDRSVFVINVRAIILTRQKKGEMKLGVDCTSEAKS
jgi:hypothetical protein